MCIAEARTDRYGQGEIFTFSSELRASYTFSLHLRRFNSIIISPFFLPFSQSAKSVTFERNTYTYFLTPFTRRYFQKSVGAPRRAPYAKPKFAENPIPRVTVTNGDGGWHQSLPTGPPLKPTFYGAFRYPQAFFQRH